jgi:hypothetical protein
MHTKGRKLAAPLFSLQTDSIGNETDSCRSSANHAERQLFGSANVSSVPKAEVGWLAKRTFRNVLTQGRPEAARGRVSSLGGDTSGNIRFSRGAAI